MRCDDGVFDGVFEHDGGSDGERCSAEVPKPQSGPEWSYSELAMRLKTTVKMQRPQVSGTLEQSPRRNHLLGNWNMR